MPFGGWQKGSTDSPGSINHHVGLTQKLKALYKNKTKSAQIANMESWVNLRLREKYEWDQVEQTRADKKKNSANDDNGEEWAVEAEDDDDY